jgi:hypothetical protein
VEDEQLAVASAADVELDPVRAELDRTLEGCERVLGDSGARRAAMGDYFQAQCAAGAESRATTTESESTRMATRSPRFT